MLLVEVLDLVLNVYVLLHLFCQSPSSELTDKDRLQLLSALVESLPADHLALIPEILSEAVLGTKEVNEKARDAGFDLLVVMGNKMAKGGSVTRVIAIEAEGEMEDGATGQEGAFDTHFLSHKTSYSALPFVLLFLTLFLFSLAR